MGIYRFVLSILVALSHSGIYFWGFNQGAVAVVSFLMISGYTAEYSISKWGGHSFKQILSYYGKRIVRLYPLYWFWVIASFIAVACGMAHETIRSIPFEAVILNFLLIPLDYISLSVRMQTWLGMCLVIPAAWTTGMQLTYYLFAPLLHFLRTKRNSLNIIIFTTSIVIFFLSLSGKLDSYWGYGLLPGMIWIFILGLYMHLDEKYEKILLFSAYLLCLTLFLYMGATGKWLDGQKKEILLGIILGLPFIYFLRSFPRGKLDDFLGNLSYGVYLNHFLIKNIMQNAIGHQPAKFNEWFLFIGLSIIGAICSHFLVECPISVFLKRKGPPSI